MGITLAGRSAEAAVEEAIEAIYAMIGQMNCPNICAMLG